jgi:hypothetical protein
MSDEKLLQLATEMEGHPDNVAAALYGNAVVAWTENQHGKEVAQAISLSVDTRIRAIAFIPATAVATSRRARCFLNQFRIAMPLEIQQILHSWFTRSHGAQICSIVRPKISYISHIALKRCQHHLRS